MAEPVNDRAAFKKGDDVVYTSNNGSTDVAVILKVHYEDDPPFYTIHITDRDVEKQTDEKNLTFLPLFDDDEDDDEDDDLSPPPPNTKPPTSPSTACKTESLASKIGGYSLGIVGFAAVGMLFIVFSRRR